MPLPRGPLQKPPEVASAPSAGKGYALNEKGGIPVTNANRAWELEYVTKSIDVPSATTDSGSTMTVSLSTLQKNDLCFYIGREDSANARGFIFQSVPVCSTAGQHTLHYFNPQAATSDPAAFTAHFLIIHRNIVS